VILLESTRVAATRRSAVVRTPSDARNLRRIAAVD